MLTYTSVYYILISSITLSVSTVFHPLSDEFIESINAQQTTWKAGHYFTSENYELFKILVSGDIKRKLPSDSENYFISIQHDESEDVPESFDARDAWPECADIIGFIRDQSKCGSCWAFSVAETASDRICIHSNATKKLLVSADDVLTCSTDGGCQGGDSLGAWIDWQNGYVTGGLYNHTEQGCKYYFLPPCDDHMNKCKPYDIPAPACSHICDDPDENYYNTRTYGNLSFYYTNRTNSIKQIQLEIMKNGPVQAIFDVYEDYANYKEGIYQHVMGDKISSHAVKIIGWGVENQTDYWLIANSFNERWGEQGFFRMLRGSNECGIESIIKAGMPDFNKF